ncbi:YbjN domain-containing protein [Saprospira grandis]|uniref:Uncharacterized protein n=1 Tax=Saprospira grandis (strain Lewin) TaxID=984262 RepID=H6L148_SAPGL|nr:YbjN domain-containing protein [Saprospira grandis]AFC26084.1 hypothetical protein SGRA_3357 [Saprospira grandis str. Lewin]WBM73986.1 YbjN domain-containing protein [Saprospira grandis]
MKQLADYYATIEAAIQKLGVDPKVCRTDKENRWHLHRGNAQVVVLLRESTTFEQKKRPSLVIVSPIVVVPAAIEARQELMELILKTNHQLITESFSMTREQAGHEVVYLSSTYFIEEMSVEEIEYSLSSQSYFALQFTSLLRKRFMGIDDKETSKKEHTPFKLDDE